MAIWNHVRNFLVAQHMPIILIALIVFGAAWPAPGIAAAATPLSTLSLGGIFVITGLGLDVASLKALMSPLALWSLVIGLISILILSPAVSLALAKLPLTPGEFAKGLALFWAMPTTNSSGILIAGAAGGSVPIAVGLSVVSNVIGVFTAPIWVSLIFGSVQISVSDLLLRLAYTVLAPLSIGIAARHFLKCVQLFVARHRLALRIASSTLLGLVPWMLISQSSANLRTLSSVNAGALVATVIIAHCVLLAFNAIIAALLGVVVVVPAESGARVSIAIMGSQKAVIVAAAVAISLPTGPDGVNAGLIMLPGVLGHLAQTLIDSCIATWWKRNKSPRDPIDDVRTQTSVSADVEVQACKIEEADLVENAISISTPPVFESTAAIEGNEA